jgi:membrane-bound lytic murein transglycosylase A
MQALPRQPAFAAGPAAGELAFDDVPGWGHDHHAAALRCFNRTANRFAEACPVADSAERRLLRRIAEAAAGIVTAAPSDAAARRFFETYFSPTRTPDAAVDGFVTGYFEPVLHASPVLTDRYRHPLYARPADLVEFDETTRPEGWPDELRYARRTATGPMPYHDRAEIDGGAIGGRGLEIAWLDNAVDLFFVHVQGSACLEMTNGERWRVTHVAKNGHRYTSIGALLVQSGAIPSRAMSMATLREWLFADLDRANRVMARNRSYIFFRRLDEPGLRGPLGSADVELMPGRSLAVDPSFHSYGAPVWVATREPVPGQDGPFNRLLIAQDSGSAIKGPKRGDIFFGSGDSAGAVAGAVRHDCDFIVLRPRDALKESQR